VERSSPAFRQDAANDAKKRLEAARTSCLSNHAVHRADGPYLAILFDSSGNSRFQMQIIVYSNNPLRHETKYQEGVQFRLNDVELINSYLPFLKRLLIIGFNILGSCK